MTSSRGQGGFHISIDRRRPPVYILFHLIPVHSDLPCPILPMRKLRRKEGRPRGGGTIQRNYLPIFYAAGRGEHQGRPRSRRPSHPGALHQNGARCQLQREDGPCRTKDHRRRRPPLECYALHKSSINRRRLCRTLELRKKEWAYSIYLRQTNEQKK